VAVADERIRVAHVITRMIVGGAQETVLLAAALADTSRFEPVVVCGPQTGSEGSLHEEVRRRGVDLVLVPELVREVRPMKDARVVGALSRLFRERGTHVVHTNSSKAGIVGRLAARSAGIPAVHTVHGWPFHDRQPSPVSSTWRLLERRTAPLARHLLVVADADRVKGLQAGIGHQDQYVTVRSGLELDRYGASAADREQVRAELGLVDCVVIGAVGRLSPQKDPLTLVRAVAPLLRSRPDSRLLLVGDGPLRGDVAAAVAAAGVTAQVVLPGLRRDVPRLLNAMDVFVLSSLWEGLPRTLVQAMATGVPVVATDADGVRDVVRHGRTGLVVPRGDVDRLRAAVASLLDDPARGEELASAARELVPAFDAQVMVRRLEELYAGVVT
jgi:glycosyltransferase involved in cell wall biosynthesis